MTDRSGRSTFPAAALIAGAATIAILLTVSPFVLGGRVVGGEELWSLLHLFSSDGGESFAFNHAGGTNPSFVSLTHPLLFTERLAMEMFGDIASFYVFNKLFVATIGFFACFLFVRVGLRAGLAVALAASSYALVISPFLSVDTVKHFYSYAMMPLAPALLLSRCSLARFAGLTALHHLAFASAATPFHASITSLATSAAIVLFVDPRRCGRLVLFWGSYALVALINWLEPLVSVKVFYGLSEHADFFHFTHFGLHAVLSSAYQFWRDALPFSLAVPLGLVLMALTRPRRLLWFGLALGMFVLPMCHRIWRMSEVFPPLGFLDTLHTEGVGFGFGLFCITVLVWSWRRGRCVIRRHIGAGPLRRGMMAASTLLAVGLALTGYGLGWPRWILPTLDNARHETGAQRDWAFAPLPWRLGLPPDLRRAVTYPCKLHPFVANRVGLETLDGPIATFPLQGTSALWRAIWPDADRNDYRIAPLGEEPGCDRAGSPDLSGVDFAVLGFLNVGWLVSVVPVDHPALIQTGAVPGPGGGVIHLYRLSESLPRAYVARAIRTDPPDSIALLARSVLRDQIAYLDSPAAPAAATGLAGVARIPNGYRVTLSSAGGGVVVINHRALPNWQAVGADGRPLTVVPANRYHLAVLVPPGETGFTLVYRPTLATLFASGRQVGAAIELERESFSGHGQEARPAAP